MIRWTRRRSGPDRAAMAGGGKTMATLLSWLRIQLSVPWSTTTRQDKPCTYIKRQVREKVILCRHWNKPGHDPPAPGEHESPIGEEEDEKNEKEVSEEVQELGRKLPYRATPRHKV